MIFRILLIFSVAIVSGCSSMIISLGSSVVSSLLGIQSGPTAIEYNDRMVDQLVAMDDLYLAYSTYAEETSIDYVDKIEKKLEQTIVDIQQKQKEINLSGAYKGDTSFLDAANVYASGMITLLNDADKERRYVNMRKKLYAEKRAATKKEEKTGELYADSINTLYEKMNADIAAVQKAFAKKHDFTIETVTGSMASGDIVSGNTGK